MDSSSIKPSLRIKTTKLGSTKMLIIKERHLNVRREGITGTVLGYAPSHDDDVLFVRHDGFGDIIGAYVPDEMKPI